MPECRKNCLKFWWDQELDILKDASIESNAVWKAAGRPRYGPIFEKRQRCLFQYRNRFRESEKLTNESYSNDLHEALLRKMVVPFGNAGDQNLSTELVVLK